MSHLQLADTIYWGDSMERDYLLVFGEHVRNLRLKTGLSQEKFALGIGMDRTYYATVESGKRNISLLNIKKIADGFGISVEQLFTDLEERSKSR